MSLYFHDKKECEAIFRDYWEAGTHRQLAVTLAQCGDDIVNSIGAVFYAGTIELKVGHALPKIQAYLRKGEGVAGLTPKFPTHNPSASDAENAFYVEDFCRRLKYEGIRFLEARGNSFDFPENGGSNEGAFLLLDVSVERVKKLLAGTQLSFTYLPKEGVAQLISCLD